MSKEIKDEKEQLAELCHKQWSGWIKYMFGKCLKKIDGTILIPEWAVTRWRRQAYTPYQKLSHKEKESDRTEADRFLTLLKQQPTAGEFTRRLRILLATQDKTAVVQDAYDLCDRLDRAEARNKELLELCEEFMEIADDGSARFDDPEPGSIFLRAEAAISKERGIDNE